LRDLNRIISWIGKELPEKEDYKNRVKILTDSEEVLNLLNQVFDKKISLTFDYETTGLKPYREGHKIIIIGIAIDNKAYAFPFDYRNYWNNSQFRMISRIWKKILKDKNIKKTAHNVKFEQSWSKEILKVDPVGWKWDSMLFQHVLEGRHGVTGLKFQSYVRWGVKDYSKDIEQYLKSSDNIAFNKLEEAPLDKLCFYCGLDALLTDKLCKEQKGEMNTNRTLANELFLEGVLAFADIQHGGINIDENYYEKEYKSLSKRINRLEFKLNNCGEAEKFKEKIGRELNSNSSKDLRTLFFDVLGIQSIKKTIKNNNSVDEEVLNRIKIPFTENLLMKRKLVKVRDTYLAQFKREVIEGKIHPFFDLHIASSFRSCSSSPNLQNIPIRDEVAKRSVRRGIIPSKGNKILEVDYSNLEVRIAACYNKDPLLINYINDPESDMHRDQAKEIFFLDDYQVTKDIRFYVKNGFVFPEFYGSYWKSCAKNLWINCLNLEIREGFTIKDHLKPKGIRTYDYFEEHVKEVEKKFWERFKIFRRWQDKQIADYLKKGYIELFLGFVREGYLKRNMIINTPIQGSAFHCLLWSFIVLNKIRKEQGWGTKILGQIHDSILFDIVPSEQDYVIKTVERVMCDDIKKEFDWLIVPLDVEFEITGIDESWYYKKELK
jgi:DNA polymerase-1